MRSSPALFRSARTGAMFESIVAMLIWSSSFIWAELGRAHMGPLTIGGLRYALAGLIILPLLFTGRHLHPQHSGSLWGRLLIMGLLMHTIGNGAIFLAMPYLSTTVLTLITCLMPLPVLVLGIVCLGEIPSWLQVTGVGITLLGTALLFAGGMATSAWIGVGLALFGLFCFSYALIIGRELARTQATSALALTGLPLLIGGFPLLAVACWWEGAPLALPWAGWAIAVVLALFNTVIAYFLYNHSMQVLTALEANIFLNLAPFVTAVLAWWLFGDVLLPVQLLGMIVVIAGITLVQWPRPSIRPAPQLAPDPMAQ
jgi:drug/metabolite transporter (DMT)-like permease